MTTPTDDEVTSTWARIIDAMLDEHRDRRQFLDERIAEMKARERPADEGEQHDLDRRLLYAIDLGSVTDPDARRVALEKRDADIDARAHEELIGAELHRLWASLAARVNAPGILPIKRTLAAARALAVEIRASLEDTRLVCAYEWPGVLSDWRLARATTGRGLFRYPGDIVPLARAIGAKRHGKAHGLPVDATAEHTRIKISLEIPRGATVDLFYPRATHTRPDDFDDEGKLTEGAVGRLLGEMGPAPALIGVAAFAMASLQAQEEGRHPDGRFWFTPTLMGDILGCARESNGKASSSRISRTASKDIRRMFELYANIEIRQEVKLGPEVHTIRGTLLYPTQKNHEARRPGQRGRDTREEWRIRDELWALMARRYIMVPVELLHKQGASLQAHGEMLLVYLALAADARTNSGRAHLGRTLSLDTLAAGISPPWETQHKARERVITHLDKLAARGAIQEYRLAELADGRKGVTVTLPDARLAELATVAARRKEITAGEARALPPRRTRKPRRP